MPNSEANLAASFGCQPDAATQKPQLPNAEAQLPAEARQRFGRSTAANC